MDIDSYGPKGVLKGPKETSRKGVYQGISRGLMQGDGSGPSDFIICF